MISLYHKLKLYKSDQKEINKLSKENINKLLKTKIKKDNKKQQIENEDKDKENNDKYEKWLNKYEDKDTINKNLLFYVGRYWDELIKNDKDFELELDFEEINNYLAGVVANEEFGYQDIEFIIINNNGLLYHLLKLQIDNKVMITESNTIIIIDEEWNKWIW